METPTVGENCDLPQTDSLGLETPPLWVRPAKVGVLLGAATAAIAAINPADSGFAVCWSQRLGIDCPLCGGLRTVTSLVHGDFLAALDHNLLLAVTLPTLAIAWAIWMASALLDRPLALPRFPNWLFAFAGLVVIAFTVARNVEGGPEWVQYLASSTYG